MTIREGWPTFGQWQQNRDLRMRTKKVSSALLTLSADLSKFAEACKSATSAITKLRVLVDNKEIGYPRNPYLADSQEWWDS